MYTDFAHKKRHFYRQVTYTCYFVYILNQLYTISYFKCQKKIAHNLDKIIY